MRGRADNRDAGYLDRAAAGPGDGLRGRSTLLAERAVCAIPDLPVMRQRLLERLLVGDVGLVTIVAPPGYGKTTLVWRWQRRDPRSFVTVGLDARDDDPVRLEDHLARAIGGARAREGADGARDGAVLVVDGAEVLVSDASRSLLAEAIQALPRGWGVAVVSRTPLPELSAVGRRLTGGVVELRMADLAITEQEAVVLAAEAGAALDRRMIGRIVEHTEGWPAAVGILLRATVTAARDGRGAPAGSDLLAEYVHEQVLGDWSEDTMRFLRRTSILERLDPPLCDVVLDTHGSRARLASLAARSALVMPLDEGGAGYRYHRVLRDVLAADLERHEPELVPLLRVRAADWYTARGAWAAAADQAMAAGDAERLDGILATAGLALPPHEQATTVQRWLRWLDDHDAHVPDAQGALVGSLAHLMESHAAAAGRWTEIARQALARHHVTDAAPHAAVQLLEAALCRHGVAAMGTHARAAVDGLVAPDLWRAAALLYLGIAELLDGDATRADVDLAQAVEVAAAPEATCWGSIALGERALIALARGDLERAASFAEQACRLVVRSGWDRAPTSSFVYAVLARTRLARGDATGSRAALAVAQRLRPGLTQALPHLAVQARLQLALCATAQADVAGARTVLREVDDLLIRRPRLGRLVDEVEEVRERIADLQADVVGATSLTAAEVRLLPLLATHLSFREIGEHLFLSRNTVKSEALSIYRKLGVSSRGDAMARVQELGLLPR